MISHAFFELPGVLADPARLAAGYPVHLGAVMAARYGLAADVWGEAYCRVRADWDGYWSDLDLTGDEPLADLWEGMFRTTRALFRLARITEPDKDELIAFSRLLPGLVYERFDALYPLARALLQGLRAEGVCLHVATHWTVGMARGLLAGGGILAFISVPIFGMDATGTFEKDYVYLALKVDALPECCLVVDSDPAALARAGAAAMQTARVRDGAGVCEVLEMILKQRHVVGDG